MFVGGIMLRGRYDPKTEHKTYCFGDKWVVL